MQLATLPQIRAARALLNWTQGDLAKAAKLSLAAVNNLERDASNPRLNTFIKIQSTLEAAGVEFQNGPGVRLRGEVFNVTTMEQGDVYTKLLDDILQTSLTENDPGGCYMNVKDEDFAAANSKTFKNYARKLRQYGLRERVLVEEGDEILMFPPDVTHYRWMPKALFGVAPFAIYGSKLALWLWGPPARVVIIENPSIVASHRRQFEFFWDQSRDPPFTPTQLYKISEKLLPLNEAGG